MKKTNITKISELMDYFTDNNDSYNYKISWNDNDNDYYRTSWSDSDYNDYLNGLLNKDSHPVPKKRSLQEEYNERKEEDNIISASDIIHLLKTTDLEQKTLDIIYDLIITGLSTSES